MADRPNQITIEGAEIIFRNFEGKEGPYNAKGTRNFAIILSPDQADAMIRDGWNVKHTNPQEEGDIPVPYLPVAVNFANRPPRIVTITSTGTRTNLTEDTVEVLDWADILNVDLIINPFAWEVNGKSGIKAYLKSLYVTIQEDELERKYSTQGGE